MRVADGRYAVSLRHPSDARFVSLRAKASDTRGNAVEQATVRAYQLH